MKSCVKGYAFLQMFTIPCYTNSGLVTSWPEAPTLDDYERYRGLSLVSTDMLDESFFRMPNALNPSSSGMAPVFNKYIVYNRRKNSFTVSKNTFESNRNFLIFYIFIYLFKDNFMKSLDLGRTTLTSDLESSVETPKSVTEISLDNEINYIDSISPSDSSALVDSVDTSDDTVTLTQDNSITFDEV